ncbi:N1R/p28-like protein [Choristoneura rosaceana entomopoxvirus 'L']|uniref:N1R/p28-like protein n=1 Tax=Choristoneura rosaceana entomopoxvirus 'L' TaxID=1293539 RepID=A0ABM9QKC0_9POXV|nr:N1R/p28-like protein [Choristoneura rosaceana entomopoxvirus 'L']CCU55988.1 N1R/p28-like protein [Choristoneura rosaceana entomopoxvirus 'L']
MSLIDICYEKIKDHYYYGLFGDFKLVIDKNTGCFNATKLCNLDNKLFGDWKRLERSKNLLNAINTRYGNSHSGFYEIKGDNNNKKTKQITGQYVSKEIILDIASWISVEFYLKCNDIIINYYKNEFKSLSDEDIQNKIKELENKYINIIDDNKEIIKQKDYKIDELNNKLDSILISNKNLEKQNLQVIEQNKNLLKLAQKQNIKLEEIGDELEETNYKLDTLTETVEEIILPDRNVSPSDINLKHNLVIYKINNAIKIIRAQNKYINKNNIPINDIIIKEYVPNPIDFINRMKLHCNEANKKFKKDLKKNNKNISYEDFIELYDSNKKMEIKYNNVFLNNSKINHIIELFNKLKKNNIIIEFFIIKNETLKMSLVDVCYEKIKDQYYYGLFGDFKLVIDKNTGCFNATKLCKLGNKDFYHWRELKISQSYIKYLKNLGTRDDEAQNILCN